jgi:hypothetical protein
MLGWIVLESLGLTFEDDEEFNEFFLPIDTDEDGLVSFSDYQEFMCNFQNQEV